MGFTRYWRRPAELSADKFEQFSKACAALYEKSGVATVTAIFDGDLVYVEASAGVEPFRIERIARRPPRDGAVSEFCKTQRLPYDSLVKDCLLELQKAFPDVEIAED